MKATVDSSIYLMCCTCRIKVGLGIAGLGPTLTPIPSQPSVKQQVGFLETIIRRGTKSDLVATNKAKSPFKGANEEATNGFLVKLLV